MAGTAQELLLLGDEQETLNSYLATLPFLALYKMQQTSGTNEPNAGSLGSALDMTLTSVTLGQTGKLGANEAYQFDGANSRMQTANNPTLAGKTAWEYVFLFNPTNAGESSFGTFFMWGNSGSNFYATFNAALTSLNCVVQNNAATAFVTRTTTGFSASTWALLFVSFDNAGDRKPHLYKGISGAVSEFSYSVNPAMTGTYAAPSVAFNIGNDSGQTLTFNGLMDLAGVVDGNLTPAQRTKITQLVGV